MFFSTAIACGEVDMTTLGSGSRCERRRRCHARLSRQWQCFLDGRTCHGRLGASGQCGVDADSVEKRQNFVHEIMRATLWDAFARSRQSARSASVTDVPGARVFKHRWARLPGGASARGREPEMIARRHSAARVVERPPEYVRSGNPGSHRASRGRHSERSTHRGERGQIDNAVGAAGLEPATWGL